MKKRPKLSTMKRFLFAQSNDVIFAKALYTKTGMKIDIAFLCETVMGAHQWQLNGLVELCIPILQQRTSMTVEHVAGIFSVADACGIKPLKDSCVKFLLSDPSHMTKVKRGF